jgi:hypothetical protein
VTDEPIPLHPEAPAEPVDEAAPGGEASAARKGWTSRLPKAPIPGTGLAVKTSTIGNDREMFADVENAELDDREFTVRLVDRQLLGEHTIDEVRAWPDEHLLAAGRAFLTLDTTTEDVEESLGGNEGDAEGEADRVGADAVEDDDDEEGELEPLTFGTFRDEIRALGMRKARRMQRLMAGIVSLSQENANKIGDIINANPTMNGTMGRALAKQMRSIQDAFGAGLNKDMFGGLGKHHGGLTGSAIQDALKSIDTTKLAGIDAAKLGGLTDTSKIGLGLSKMLADNAAMERFTRPAFELPEARTYEPALLDIGPIERPEVGLLEEVSERLERMHTDEVRTSDHQIEVMIQQSALLKAQGEALTALVNDAKGQTWPRRVVLATSIIAAIAAVLALAFSAGILRPAG